jgi:hypothetical protein
MDPQSSSQFHSIPKELFYIIISYVSPLHLYNFYEVYKEAFDQLMTKYLWSELYLLYNFDFVYLDNIELQVIHYIKRYKALNDYGQIIAYLNSFPKRTVYVTVSSFSSAEPQGSATRIRSVSQDVIKNIFHIEYDDEFLETVTCSIIEPSARPNPRDPLANPFGIHNTDNVYLFTVMPSKYSKYKYNVNSYILFKLIRDNYTDKDVSYTTKIGYF